MEKANASSEDPNDEEKGEAYQVTYEKTKENYRNNPNYNIWIAAAVTGHARTRLHRQMIKIGPERILYCDTD